MLTLTTLLILNLVATPSLSDSKRLGAGERGEKLYYHFPPDPVNPKTLNFFLPVDQISLPCYLPIEIKPAYNSYAGDASIFGSKWTFNYNIFVKRVGNHFEVMEGDGFSNPYNKEKNLEEAKKALTEQLVVAKKKADVQSSGGIKAPAVYEEYRKRLLTDVTYREDQEEKLLTGSKNLGLGKYYSLARGASSLEFKTDGTFVRSFQNGAEEIFNRDGKISKSIDRNGNSITFAYSGSQMVRVNDQCGRYMSLSYKSEKSGVNLIDSIRDSLGREVKYDFFPDHRLKSFRDAGKKLVEYTYDKDSNMTSMTTSPAPPDDKNKEVILLSYNSKGEVATQTGPGKIETKYTRTFVANNPNHTISEISRTVNGKLESREVQEYKLKEFEETTKFDSAGKEIKKEIRKISPVTGYPVSILDGQGNGELYDYDGETGNLIRRQTIPGKEITEFAYDPKCNQVVKMTTKHEGQGDSVASFTFDSKCNLLEAKEIQNKKNKVWITIKWNPQGKIQFLVNKLANKEVAFTYWKFGKPDSITLKDSGSLIVTYSPLGEIDKVDTFPHGKAKEHFKNTPRSAYQATILAEVRSALDEMLGYLKPAGVSIGL